MKKILKYVLTFFAALALCFAHYRMHDNLNGWYEVALLAVLAVVSVVDVVIWGIKCNSETRTAMSAVRKRWRRRFLKFTAVYAPAVAVLNAAAMAFSWEADINFCFSLPFVPALFLTYVCTRGFMRFKRITAAGLAARVTAFMLFLIVTDVATVAAFCVFATIRF